MKGLGDLDYDIVRRKTAPALLAERARATPNAVAYRAKHLGIYRERTWADFRDVVARCAEGFVELGLEKGGRVALMGDPTEEWTVADMAAQADGGITYGIYPTSSVSELEYQMRDGGAAIFVAEDQEYVDKILPIADDLPDLRWIVVVDTTAMFTYDHSKLISFAEVLDKGAARGAPDPDRFDAMVAKVDPADPAFIVYTSGTTGPPKGALIAHGKYLAAAWTFVDLYPTLAHDHHRTVVFLPLGHIFGRDIGVGVPLMTNLIPHYGESIEDLPTTLFEVAPTVIATVPRYLQKFLSQVLVGIENTTPFKRALHDIAMRVGRRYIARRWDGRAGLLDAALYHPLRWLAFRPILNKIGFDKLRLVLSGGAPLAPETMALWQILGLNVAEIYGQTESGGSIIAGQPGEFPRPGDIGRAPRGWSVELGEDGEILVSGSDMFEGYWGKPDKTAEVFDERGRLLTGDIGAWRDGALRIIDRKRDFIVTAGGKTLSPTYIENVLRSSPYVSEAIVFGHNKKYCTALVEIDHDTVADWARANNVTYTGFTNLTERPEVMRLIKDAIDRANEDLARVEQIKAFRILPKVLDPEEEGEPVTPTRKVKRELLYKRFSALVDGMYTDAEERAIAAGLGDVLGDREASPAGAG